MTRVLCKSIVKHKLVALMSYIVYLISLRTSKIVQKWYKLFAKENGDSSRRNEYFRPILLFGESIVRKWLTRSKNGHFGIQEDHLTLI